MPDVRSACRQRAAHEDGGARHVPTPAASAPRTAQGAGRAVTPVPRPLLHVRASTDPAGYGEATGGRDADRPGSRGARRPDGRRRRGRAVHAAPHARAPPAIPASPCDQFGISTGRRRRACRRHVPAWDEEPVQSGRRLLRLGHQRRRRTPRGRAPRARRPVSAVSPPDRIAGPERHVVPVLQSAGPSASSRSTHASMPGSPSSARRLHVADQPVEVVTSYAVGSLTLSRSPIAVASRTFPQSTA